jgi:hypothetical protein
VQLLGALTQGEHHAVVGRLGLHGSILLPDDALASPAVDPDDQGRVASSGHEE